VDVVYILGTQKQVTVRFSTHVPYILKSNPHPFYSFRGLKNQMWIRFAGFWKNDRAGVRAVTIQYNYLLFYF
jgi:hypothetical protein